MPMSARDLALWAAAVMLAAAAGVLAWHIAVAPSQGVAAVAAEEEEQGPNINDVTVGRKAGTLGYLSSGRRSEVVAGTDEGVKVYQLREYRREYEVTDVTEGAEGASEAGGTRSGRPGQ
ncbi:MAG: hypothetical protein ACE5R4_09320 [Armatimonadota bacterium]